MKVLIIDDEEHILQTMSMAFQRLGHQTVTLTQPLKAVPTAKREKPDAVLLDIMMPGADGFATFHSLSEVPELAGVPIIILTALDDDLTARISREIGAELILHKPFNPLEVARRVVDIYEARKKADD
ncbi:MAG: response regulator [Candidatus Coatesbacteria bacterium]|nr:response regulator [Candidatus Coatesbacteria bacterium]